MAITKILGLWDSHFPHEIPLNPLCQFAKEYIPNIFILGGDNWSLDIISHWNDADFKNIGFDNIKQQLLHEAQEFKSQLDNFRHYMPKATFIYIVGNHEDWLRQFSAKYPQMNDLSLESLLDLKKRNIKLIPFSGTYSIGKLNFKHGHEFTSENTPKQAVARCHHPIVFGHHHGHAVWTDFSDLNDKEKHIGILVPCYCHRAPDYIKGRPNRWTNGFFVGNVKPSGNFSASVQLVDYKGEFITQLGKEYTSAKS